MFALTLLAMLFDCMLFSILWNWIHFQGRWSGGVEVVLQLILLGTPVLNTVVLWLYLWRHDRERRAQLSLGDRAD